MNYQKGNTALIVLSAGALLIVILAGFLFFEKKQKTATSIVSEVKQTSQETPTDPNLKTFTSINLGISFQYLEIQNDQVFSAKEVGNRIYVYETKYPETQGQYIEVFSKNKDDDIKQVIEKKFLPSYSKTDCFVVIGTNPVFGQPAPENYTFAEINFPKPEGGDMESFFSRAEKCPATYTSTNGISYFLTDTNHPDKIFFFSIGQYAIDAGPKLPWQSTIKFL